MSDDSIELMMQTAIEHHRAGRFAEAESSYRLVLARAPEHADALNLLGVLAGQGGRPDIADRLRGEWELQARSSSGESLAAVADHYERVVRGGLLKDAVALPPEQRQAILPGLAGRLEEAARVADQLARDQPAERAAPLLQIAAAARDGNQGLLGLLASRA